jgi:large subunit ribosomal protein L21e
MTKKSAGLFSGRTRHLARHHKPSQLSVGTYIKEFNVGEKAAIVQKGNRSNIPHPRYRGKIGTVVERRGSAYVVEVRTFNAIRKLTVPVEHMEKVTTGTKAQ